MIYSKIEYNLTIYVYTVNEHFFNNYFGRKTMYYNYPYNQLWPCMSSKACISIIWTCILLKQHFTFFPFAYLQELISPSLWSAFIILPSTWDVSLSVCIISFIIIILLQHKLIKWQRSKFSFDYFFSLESNSRVWHFYLLSCSFSYCTVHIKA